MLAVMDLEQAERDPEVERLIREREEARREKQWEAADRTRARLREIDVEVVDTSFGPRWRRICRKD